MKKILFLFSIMGLCLLAFLASPSQAQVELPEVKVYTNQTFDIRIPFEWVRKTLPEDGQPFTVWQGKKEVEPLESDPFFKHELAQVAYGKTLRAKVTDRHLETWMKPGIYIKNNKIHASGGWRMHKKSTLLPDFHDGTYEADVVAKVANKKIIVVVENEHFTYNSKTLSSKLGRPFLSLFEKQMGNRISKMIEDAFAKAIYQSMEDTQAIMRFVDILDVNISGQYVIVSGKLKWF